MNIIKKIYWSTRNKIESKYRTLLKQGTGCLSHREDIRDYEFGILGIPSAKNNTFSLDTGIRFNQYPFNICVFASRVQGISMQEGIRFSARWDVKLARHLGMINGNGWSYLRAENDIGTKYGRLPYELMPDETEGMSWEEYSEWTDNDEKLLSIASNFKTPAYRSIFSRYQAIDALDRGFVLFTAGKWFTAMNNPVAPLFILKAEGNYCGGHAYISTGYRGWGDDFENPQTFGTRYGDNGKAWIDTLFGKNQYAIYIEENIPMENKIKYYVDNYKGIAIKGTGPEIYEIIDGKKFHFPNIEKFNQHHSSFKIINQSILEAIPNGGEYNF